MKKDIKTGPYFKFLRENKAISGTVLVKRGLISQGRLSRWENGEVELPWPLVKKLLLEIGSDFDEFVYSLGKKERVPLIQLKILVEQKDKEKLKDFQRYYGEQWRKTADLKDIFYTAFATNSLGELKKKIKVNFDNIEVILDNLAVNNHWYMRDVRRFKKIQLLLDDTILYDLGKSLIKYFEMTYYDGQLWYFTAYNAVINACLLLLKRNQVNLFSKLLDELTKVENYKEFSEIKIKITFLKLVKQYLMYKEKNKLNNFFKELEAIGLEKIKVDLEKEYTMICDYITNIN